MKYALIVIALLVLVSLIMDFNSRTAELNRLTAEKEAVSARLVDKLLTKAALETQIAYATSEAAVEDWAYGNHMKHSGDISVVPVEVSPITPTPTPRPVVVATQVSNLERWLSLFFDVAPATSP